MLNSRDRKNVLNTPQSEIQKKFQAQSRLRNIPSSTPPFSKQFAWKSPKKGEKGAQRPKSPTAYEEENVSSRLSKRLAIFSLTLVASSWSFFLVKRGQTKYFARDGSPEIRCIAGIPDFCIVLCHRWISRPTSRETRFPRSDTSRIAIERGENEIFRWGWSLDRKGDLFGFPLYQVSGRARWYRVRKFYNSFSFRLIEG